MSRSEATVDNLKKMVESIHEYNKDIQIVINLRHMPATQDGFGMFNYVQNSQVMINETFTLNELLIDAFDNNPDYQNVYVSELVFNIDSEHDYETIDVPLSARNPNHVSIQNDSVHPSIYEYAVHMKE